VRQQRNGRPQRPVEAHLPPRAGERDRDDRPDVGARHADAQLNLTRVNLPPAGPARAGSEVGMQVDEHAPGVATFQTQYSQDTARIFAFTALSMVPALGFFVLAERRIVAGLTGSLKG